MNLKQLSKVADTSNKRIRVLDYNQKAEDNVRAAAEEAGGRLETWYPDGPWSSFFPNEEAANMYEDLISDLGFSVIEHKDTKKPYHPVARLNGGIKVIVKSPTTSKESDKSFEGTTIDENTVRGLMLKDLKEKLDKNQVLYFTGADRPGEHVWYCSNKSLPKVLNELTKEFELEGTKNEKCEEIGINPKHKYFRIAKDWNDTGDWHSSSADSVAGLDPAIDVNVDILEHALEKGYITADQIEFCDDNEEFPFENIKGMEKFWEEN